MDLAIIKEVFQTDPISIVDKSIRFCGWVKRVREGDKGALLFVDVYDGTTVGVLCGVCDATYKVSESSSADRPEFKTLSFDQIKDPQILSAGCSVQLDGILVKSPEGATQQFELKISTLKLIGGVTDPFTYPIQKTSEKSLTSLRQLPFMRMRAPITQSLFRIRGSLIYAVHLYFQQEGVPCLDPNIITCSDCEGAGETFGITPQIFSKDAEGKDIPVGLTVSSQLPLEALITGTKRVYTCQKSFRAEKSDTSKHLAEFLHVEYEECFTSLDKLMTDVERMVKFYITYVLKHCSSEYDFMESPLAPPEFKGIRESLRQLLDKPFTRIKHCDAVALIRKDVEDKVMVTDETGKEKRVKMDKLPTLDGDLDSEHEKYLVKKFGGFVFVTHWPLKIKSFYMEQTDDGSGECNSFDLLAPRTGEMFGGSMREWRYDRLHAEITKRQMNIEPLQWFVDLRKSGSAPHGGWGMGFDRLLMFLTGVSSVRDIVPFPVYYEHCPY